MLIIYYY